MSIRSVLRIGHPSLRGRSAEIPDDWFGSQRLQTLIDDLFDTKSACSGVGIAAPQIGEPWRVFVLGMKHNPRYPEAPPLPERVVINPVFKAIGEESTTFWEGCLSVPGMRGEVKRSKYIHLQYQDQEGFSHQEELEGFHARAIQHEVDHLDGVFFTDRLTSTVAFGFIDELQAHGLIP